MSYSLISKKSTIYAGFKPLNPNPNPVSNYPMFILYTHVNAKDGTVLQTHNRLVFNENPYFLDLARDLNNYDKNDIFFVHIVIPHYELNGADISQELEFTMNLGRLEVNKIYKIPFEEKIHSFILRENGDLDYYVHS